tara:strand:+ start:6475 stop:7089 length:615 start_codon:yes stop_codon:yes gene_type:complete
MKIISHRGLWRTRDKQNSLLAFSESFSHNFGTELDVRDLNNEIVVSHDIPSQNALKLSEVIKLDKIENNILAVNIKADGILKRAEKILNKAKCEWYFFDMSFPETIICHKNNFPFFIRVSEYEQINELIDKADGIWLDSFNSTWYDADSIKYFLDLNKKLCIVSSELHGREYKKLWKLIHKFKSHENISICTDLPFEAENFFNN